MCVEKKKKKKEMEHFVSVSKMQMARLKHHMDFLSLARNNYKTLTDTQSYGTPQ